MSELEDVLKKNLDYISVDWFIAEIIKLENQRAFRFKNTKKYIIVTD